VDIGEVDCRG